MNYYCFILACLRSREDDSLNFFYLWNLSVGRLSSEIRSVSPFLGCRLLGVDYPSATTALQMSSSCMSVLMWIL